MPAVSPGRANRRSRALESGVHHRPSQIFQLLLEGVVLRFSYCSRGFDQTLDVLPCALVATAVPFAISLGDSADAAVGDPAPVACADLVVPSCAVPADHIDLACRTLFGFL